MKAVTLATGAPYDEVHANFDRHGRKRSRGTPLEITAKVLRRRGVGKHVRFKRARTLRRFKELNARGTYIVYSATHMLCVRDGMQSDDTNVGTHILGY